jgi:hypothetical protein
MARQRDEGVKTMRRMFCKSTCILLAADPKPVMTFMYFSACPSISGSPLNALMSAASSEDGR